MRRLRGPEGQKAYSFAIPAYPSWYYDTGQGQGESCQGSCEWISPYLMAVSTLTSQKGYQGTTV